MFDELLAYEYTSPASFGAVHHLTVSAYCLQHPRGFSREAIETWRVILAESLDGVSTPSDFLRRARSQSATGVRVRDPGSEPPEGWPRSWPMTVADIIPPTTEAPDADTYVDRVRRWAAAIRETLGNR